MADTVEMAELEAMGQGVLDGRHPLSQTGPFGHRLWPEIDLVIGILRRVLRGFYQA